MDLQFNSAFPREENNPEPEEISLMGWLPIGTLGRTTKTRGMEQVAPGTTMVRHPSAPQDPFQQEGFCKAK